MTFWQFWGHSEALFEHETAIDIQKVYSISRLFVVECFHSSIIQNLQNFQRQIRFSEKDFGFSTHLGRSKRIFYLVNYSFPSKNVLHSLMNHLELQDHLVSQTISKIVKIRKPSTFYTNLQNYKITVSNQQIPSRKANWKLTAFVVEPFYHSNPRTFLEIQRLSTKTFEISFYFPTHLCRFEVFCIKHFIFRIK